MSQLIVQIYERSRTALKAKARVVMISFISAYRLFTGKSEQNFSLESTPKDGYDILALFVVQCTTVTSSAVHSGKK